MNKNAAEAVDAVKGFLNRAFRDHVSAYAAQAAYFIILSFYSIILFCAYVQNVLPVCIYVLHMHSWCLWRPLRGEGIPLGLES